MQSIADVRERFIKRRRDTKEAYAFAEQFNALIAIGRTHGASSCEKYI